MKWQVTSCLVALLVGSAASARAETVLFTQLDDHGDDVAVSGFDLESSRATGRAWVSLDVYRRDITGLGEIDQHSLVRAHVPGLSRVDDRIVFSSGARQTVCATVVHRRFLWWKYEHVEKTGRCDVTTTPNARRADDGFEVTAIPVVSVYFRVQE